MAVLLDTDHFSILQQNRDSAAPLKARLGQLPSGAINVCIISFQEQAKGWLAFIHRAKKQRMRIGTNDLRIAAIAKANAVKLLSAICAIFARSRSWTSRTGPPKEKPR